MPEIQITNPVVSGKDISDATNIKQYNREEMRKRISDAVAKEQKKKKSHKVVVGDTKIQTIRFSTGVAGLDYIFGGGMPFGHMMEIAGWEGSGKTTTALTIIAAAQKEGLMCGFVDIERTYDPLYAAALGVDTEGLMVGQPETGEDALEMVVWMIEELGLTIVAVDSIAAMLPVAEREGDVGQAHMSLQARLMGQATRKLVPVCAQRKASIIWLNQLRTNPGAGKYENPEYTPGGNAMRFYASIRVKTHASKRKEEGTGDNREGIGKDILVTVYKNKTAKENRRVRLYIEYGLGFDAIQDLAGAVEKFNVLEKSGSWFVLDGENLVNGKANLENLLREDEALHKRIYQMTAEAIEVFNQRERAREVDSEDVNDPEFDRGEGESPNVFAKKDGK